MYLDLPASSAIAGEQIKYKWLSPKCVWVRKEFLGLDANILIILLVSSTWRTEMVEWSFLKMAVISGSGHKGAPVLLPSFAIKYIFLYYIYYIYGWMARVYKTVLESIQYIYMYICIVSWSNQRELGQFEDDCNDNHDTCRRSWP